TGAGFLAAFGRLTHHRAAGCADRATDDCSGRATDGHPDGRSPEGSGTCADRLLAALVLGPQVGHFRFRPCLVMDVARIALDCLRRVCVTHRRSPVGASRRSLAAPVAAMSGPPSGPRTVETYGTRGVSAGWRRFQRSAARASRRSNGNEGTEKTSAAMPKRSARRAWAATAWGRIEPDPSSLARWAF